MQQNGTTTGNAPRTDLSSDMDFNVPAQENFDTPGLQGSIQQILADNVGNFVVCEFLIGTQSLVERSGVLYTVGTGFLVLFEEVSRTYVVCDIFSIKFVTFYLPGMRPQTVQNGAQSAQPAQPTFATRPRGRR